MSSYPFLDLVWTMIVFFAWVIWFWLLIVIFGDLFRRSDTSGWMKALWTLGLIVLPFIGVLIYLIVEGRHMADRRQQQVQAAQGQFDDYVRTVAHSDGGGGASNGTPTDQLVKAKKLLDDGAITPSEYDSLKQKVLTH